MQATDHTPYAPSRQADIMSAWLRLEQTPGLGPVRAARLLARFGDPLAVFAAPQPELAAVVGPKLAATLAQPPAPALADYIKKVEDWLGQDGHHLLTQDHPGYPALLREIADAPLLLYAKGRVDLLDRAAVAIVGSRNATVQGQTNARAFAHALAGAGLTVVSGMALGIDAAAHEGALDGAGSTVAVVGTGVDRIYPARNQALARRIAGQGCLISEYPLGMEPLSANFPRRNRIISGLCQAVLVVEAAAQSGSLITAHVANEQGRDVFAIPGSIHAPLSKGCHRLIKEGAALVESIDDLLEALHIGARRVPTAAAPADVADEYAPLLDLLAHGPVHADQLANAGNVDPALLAGQLLALELAGQLERLPGGLFQRVYR